MNKIDLCMSSETLYLSTIETKVSKSPSEMILILLHVSGSNPIYIVSYCSTFHINNIIYPRNFTDKKKNIIPSALNVDSS